MTGTQDYLGANFSCSTITLLDNALGILSAMIHRLIQNRRCKGTGIFAF